MNWHCRFRRCSHRADRRLSFACFWVFGNSSSFLVSIGGYWAPSSSSNPYHTPQSIDGCTDLTTTMTRSIISCHSMSYYCYRNIVDSNNNVFHMRASWEVMAGGYTVRT